MKIGDKVHFLTIIGDSFFEETKSGRKVKKVLCKCDCGTEKNILVQSLKHGTKSCGCYGRKAASERMKKINYDYNRKHGLSQHPIYRVWLNMKKQCKNSNGNILICDEWNDAKVFYHWAINNGWQKGLSLVRKDLNKGFIADNCEFVTKSTMVKMNYKSNRKKAIKTCLEKYGVEHASKLPEFQKQRKKTCLEKYGVEYPGQIEEGKIKAKQTSLKKYGTENPAQSEAVKEKMKATNLERHGVEYPGQSKEIMDKVRATNMERYGVESTLKDPVTLEKIRQTMLEKYGVDNPFASKEVWEKIYAANIEKYGTKFPQQLPEIRQKSAETCREKYGPWYHVNNKEQKSLYYWFYKLGIIFEPDVLILSGGKEIDLYNEELKLGIEYCGLYWHNENTPRRKSRRYHYNKYAECKEKGIKLITIFADEWLQRRSQAENFLRSVVRCNTNIINARDCSIEKIDTKTGKQFINEHHIQEQKRSGIYYLGLTHKDKLVGILSLNKHHRNNINSEIIIDRVCFEDNTYIVGGSQKLISHTKDWCTKNNYKKIVTWSDNRWSDGKMYENCGFKLDEELPPDYSYVVAPNYDYRVSKQSMKKSKTGCPQNTTEKDWCSANGYHRIWDCGKKRYIIEL